MFSKFFINRPIFATVLALLIVVAGLVTLNILPVAQFPEITPPTVQVSAVYPGANAETVAQTVGIPIEQQVNGVDGMLYMSSNSSSSGAYSLTITFAVGTDIDMATVQVQNRVSIAQSSLPEPVVVQGVTVQKQSSNIVMFLTMTSQDSVYNSLYLTNYAKLNLVDQLTRVPGVGAVNVEESACQAEVAPILSEMDNVNKQRNELKDKQKDKKEEEIPTSEKDELNNLDKKWDDLKGKKEAIFIGYASNNKVIRQLIDLALLQNNMLRGEALNNFVKRSIELI